MSFEKQASQLEVQPLILISTSSHSLLFTMYFHLMDGYTGWWPVKNKVDVSASMQDEFTRA